MFVALGAWSPAAVQAVREGLVDTWQRLAPRPRGSAPVTIVEIDEKTLAERGQWPWPRTQVAELVSRIAQERPAAIGLDLLFPERDRFSPASLGRLLPDLPADLADRLQALPGNDERLAAALRGRNVVVAIAGLDERTPQTRPPLRQFSRVLASLPEIERAAAGRGLISVDAPDRIVRRVPLVARVGEDVVPALSLELWRVASGARGFTVQPGPHGLLQVAFADRKVPLQRDGSMWLRYSRHDPMRFLSASAVLGGRADGQLLRDKLVLVGVTGLGLLDFKTTPIGEQVPGVELHAQLIEQIFDQTYLVRPEWAPWLEAGILILGASLLILLVPAARVRFSVGTLALLLILLVALSAGGFLRGLIIDAAWPALGLTAAFAVLLAAALSEADRQRRELREAAARSAGELEAARRIQMGLLPDPAALFADEPGFALRAVVQPARSVGGDFYDCFRLADGRLFFVVGDVSGKGMPAALFMALCKATLKAAALSSGGDPGAALRRAALEIGRDNPEAFFVTVFAATFGADGHLQFCNAGHEPPYLRSAGVSRLPSAQRPPVGVPDGFPFVTETRMLAGGDWLCAISDGITEAMNEQGELYGSPRLERLLAAVPRDAEPATVAEAVLEDVRQFVGAASASDDLTLLVLKASGR